MIIIIIIIIIIIRHNTEPRKHIWQLTNDFQENSDRECNSSRNSVVETMF